MSFWQCLPAMQCVASDARNLVNEDKSSILQPRFVGIELTSETRNLLAKHGVHFIQYRNIGN
jgi:hypothetical protein